METIRATAVHSNNTWHVVVQQNLQKWQPAGKRRSFHQTICTMWRWGGYESQKNKIKLAKDDTSFR